MARQTDVNLKVEFTPLPPERVPAWCAGLLLLHKWMRQDCNANQPFRMQEFINMQVALPGQCGSVGAESAALME